MPPEGELSPAEAKLILIVEDDDSSRELMEAILKKEGFRLAGARDGEDGLEKARELKPDLILLDMRLPKFGGAELVRMFQEGATAGIPIVIVSGQSAERINADELRREPNVKGFYQKPVNGAAIGMALHMLLKTRPQLSGKPPAW